MRECKKEQYTNKGACNWKTCLNQLSLILYAFISLEETHQGKMPFLDMTDTSLLILK